mgnify:CR=1 FL=1
MSSSGKNLSCLMSLSAWAFGKINVEEEKESFRWLSLAYAKGIKVGEAIKRSWKRERKRGKAIMSWNVGFLGRKLNYELRSMGWIYIDFQAYKLESWVRNVHCISWYVAVGMIKRKMRRKERREKKVEEIGGDANGRLVMMLFELIYNFLGSCRLLKKYGVISSQNRNNLK